MVDIVRKKRSDEQAASTRSPRMTPRHNRLSEDVARCSAEADVPQTMGGAIMGGRMQRAPSHSLVRFCVAIFLTTAACDNDVRVPCATCAQACATDADCASGEVCFVGGCALSARRPDMLVLPEPGLIDIDLTRDTIASDALFARSSVATSTREGTGIASVEADRPRAQVDRFGLPLGTLIEAPTTNLCRDSASVGASSWWKARTAAELAARQAPDGTQAATRVTPSDNASYHSVGQSFPTVEDGVVYTFSMFVKADGLDVLSMGVGSNTTFPSQFLDLTSGSLTTARPHASVVDANMHPVGDGWYRAWVAFTNAGLDVVNVMAELGQQPPSTENGVLFWGCQLERARLPSSYIPSAVQTRAADVLTVRNPERFDAGSDFTALVVQSGEFASTGQPAVGLTVHVANASWSQVIGQNTAGTSWFGSVNAAGGTTQNLGVGNVWRDGEVHAIAVARRGNDYVLVDNGLVTHGTNDTLPRTPTPADRIGVGRLDGYVSAPTYIQRVVLWQKAFDEATLIEMTRP